METDPNINRFFSLLSLFAFSMLIIVSADNMLILILGWEFVGLTSYLLVSFWNTRISANLGALAALYQNKVGDLALIFSMLGIFVLTNDMSIHTISHWEGSGPKSYIIGFGILIAALSKSAFFPFNTWLIRAKEGPTSVSS